MTSICHSRPAIRQNRADPESILAKIPEQVGDDKNRISRKSCRVKVGHCGTLDPFATGLLILVSGRETKNAAKFAKLDKVYLAKIRLGATSTTGDPEGEIVTVIPTEAEESSRNQKDSSTAKSGEPDFFAQNDNEKIKIPSRNEIEKVIREKFTGEIWQTPPIFSAIKIDGERAYKLARRISRDSRNELENDKNDSRKDLENKIPPRKITIFAIEIINYQWPSLEIRAHVSSGTYIRSLAEDIGKELKTGAYCQELRREKIGEYDVKNAQTLAEFLQK